MKKNRYKNRAMYSDVDSMDRHLKLKQEQNKYGNRLPNSPKKDTAKRRRELLAKVPEDVRTLVGRAVERQEQ